MNEGLTGVERHEVLPPAPPPPPAAKRPPPPDPKATLPQVPPIPPAPSAPPAIPPVPVRPVSIVPPAPVLPTSFLNKPPPPPVPTLPKAPAPKPLKSPSRDTVGPFSKDVNKASLSVPRQSDKTDSGPPSASAPAPVPVPAPKPRTAPPKQRPKRVKAIYNCKADNADELTFSEGEVIIVDGEEDKEWWVGHIDGEPTRKGVFPVSFVHFITD